MSCLSNISALPIFAENILTQGYTLEQDLALEKNPSGQWHLIDLRKKPVDQKNTVISGEALRSLMFTTANNSKQLSLVGDDEIAQIMRDPQFRSFCRKIPGLESDAHKARRKKIMESFERAVGFAKVIGKGLDRIKQQGFEGSYIAQKIDRDQSYWIREIILRNHSMPFRAADVLIRGWRQDRESQHSFGEWVSAKQKEWRKEEKEGGVTFFDYVATLTYSQHETQTWQKVCSQKDFGDRDFKEWKEQNDPLLGEPLWLLREKSKTKNEDDFQIWRAKLVANRIKKWENFKEETGAQLALEEFLQESFVYYQSGSVDRFECWLLQRLWGKEKSQDEFPVYIKKLKWTQQVQKEETEESFDRWRDPRELALQTRYRGSHLPIPFDRYQFEQDECAYMSPVPFISLGKEERKVYVTTCSKGVLQRNGFPFNTAFEKTFRSGTGSVLFVIGPDLTLYCGSHVEGVFHHSSFLDRGAIVAGGEIKTDVNGKITDLFGNSGHYRPTHIHNRDSLFYFRDRGVDCSKVNITFFSSEGGIETQNAQQYLDELEEGFDP